METRVLYTESHYMFSKVMSQTTLYDSLREVYDALEKKYSTTIGTKRYSLEDENVEPYCYEDLIRDVEKGRNPSFFYEIPDESRTCYVIVYITMLYIVESGNIYFIIRETEGRTQND